MPTMMTEERLKSLIFKHLAKTLTEEERQELTACAAKHPEVGRLIARFEDEDQLTRDLRDLQRSLEKAKPKTFPILQMIPPLLQKINWRSAAVVVGVIALIGGAVFKIKQNAAVNKLPPLAMQAGTAGKGMPPGSNKADLTLENNHWIILNGIHPGKMNIPDTSQALKTDSGLSYVFLPKEGHTIHYHTLTTPGAGTFTLTLPDRSKVWLNNATSLRYPTAFTGSRREVSLSGEAYFEVAADPGRPFFVKAKHLQVEALGTNFNVMAYPDEKIITTTLLTGSVKLSDNTRQAILKPDEQINIEENKDWSKPVKADPEDISAWKAGYFRFDHTPVPIAIQRLSRWYGKVIEIEEKARQRFCSGMVKRDLELSEILKTLNLKYRQEDNRLIILD